MVTGPGFNNFFNGHINLKIGKDVINEHDVQIDFNEPFSNEGQFFPSGENFHVVGQGDTRFSISSENGVSSISGSVNFVLNEHTQNVVLRPDDGPVIHYNNHVTEDPVLIGPVLGDGLFIA